MSLLLAAQLCLLLTGGAATVAADRVVVVKADRTMTLYRGTETLRTYKVALGRNPLGPKEEEGDGRTPEGVYVIDGRNPQSAFHRSLHISYPSAGDRRRATNRGVRPGGAIMIHGLPNGLGGLGAAHVLRDWTEGCIAVTDAEIEQIWRMVPNGTRIEIRP